MKIIRNHVRRFTTAYSLALLVLLLSIFLGCYPDQSRLLKTPDPKPQRQPGRFYDVAQESGLAAFRHVDGSSGLRYFVEQIGGGAAVFDYNGDGWPDIFLCSGAALPGYTGAAGRCKLFRNKHDGTFEDVTEKAGLVIDRYAIGAAVGDYDNDGRPDLVVTCFGANILYRNNGNGIFTDVTKKAGFVDNPRLSTSAAWGDYDGDGYLDLYVCHYVKYDIKHEVWCGKFAGQKSYCGPNSYPPETGTLYHNNGDGTFTDVSVSSGISKKTGNGFGAIWLDFNDDGRPDLYCANDQTPNLLWRNNGNGTFTEVGLETGAALGELGNAQAGMGVDAGDFDNDGHLDLLVTNFSEEANALFHFEQGGYRDLAFASGMGSATLMYLGFGTGFIDSDSDGYLDLFFANGHVMDDIEKYSDGVTWKQSNQLFRNRHDGTFEEVSTPTGIAEGKHVSRGAAFGDLFNRGRTDIVVNVLREQPLLLRNECAPKAHWLELDLHASWGNPQAIGAKIWLKAGGITQRRDVKTAGSFVSSSDVRPLFGLGENTKVDELKILWPSGQTTRAEGPPIDRIMRVDEPPSSKPHVH